MAILIYTQALSVRTGNPTDGTLKLSMEVIMAKPHFHEKQCYVGYLSLGHFPYWPFPWLSFDLIINDSFMFDMAQCFTLRLVAFFREIVLHASFLLPSDSEEPEG